jgi:hypothetical protein
VGKAVGKSGWFGIPAAADFSFCFFFFYWEDLCMTQNYTEGYEYLSSQFPEVSGYDFYREMFPNNERSDERHMDYSHPNAIYLYREQTSDGFKRMRRRIMFSDQWENDYMEFIEQNPLTLCSGLSYRGKSNKLEHAQRMNALIFDLDGVGLKELRNLFLRFGGDPTRIRRLPMPILFYLELVCTFAIFSESQ